jgi:N-acetyl-alpha-D-muramate 1-phosphate uridylyltransferase
MTLALPKRVLLLAAGRGERLRPLTLHTPKPLLVVGGETLIGWQLKKLQRAGITQVAINTSWLAEQFHATLGDGTRFGVNITYFDEGPEPLETAGAIVNALGFFADEPFGVISADVYCDALPPPLSSPEAAGQLWLVPNPAHHPGGDFALEAGECRPDGVTRLTYSGIGTFRPQAFRDLAPGRRALRPLFEYWAAFGRLRAATYPEYWCDVGSEARLRALQARLSGS